MRWRGAKFVDELTEGLALCDELVERGKVLRVAGVLLMSGTLQVLQGRERETTVKPKAQ